MSLDDRSSPAALSLSRELADVLLIRRHDYASAGINDLLGAATRQWVLWVSDDEEPGTDLWKMAARPQLPLAYRVCLVSPLSSTTHYERGIEHQVRLFPRRSYHWEGDVNGDAVVTVPLADLPNTVLWHYGASAPLEERETKERFQTSIGDGTSYRYFPERYPDAVVPMPEIFLAQRAK